MASSLYRTAHRLLRRRLPISIREQSTAANILKCDWDDTKIPNYTVDEYIWQNLDRWPDKTSTVCAVTGHGYTYAQTHRMSVCFAASLRTKLKLREGDKVAVILPNIPEYPCTVLGIFEAGCVPATINPAYTAVDLKPLLEIAGCKAIVTTKFSYPNVVTALKEMKSKMPVIIVDNEGLPEGTIKFAEFAEDFAIDTDCLKSVKRSPNDIAILPYSGGTTGLPKAVALTHKNIISLNEMINHPNVITVEEATATSQTVVPAVLPFFHIFGLNVVMLNLMTRGVKLVTMPTFKPDLFIETIVKYRVKNLYLVPPIIMFLAKHPAVKPEYVQSVREIIIGAASMTKSDAETLVSKNDKIIIRQGYGLTETSGAVTVLKKGLPNKHDSVGHVFGSNEVQIVDPETQDSLGPGQECAETKKKYTYKQLQQYSATFATFIRKKLSLNEDDVVAVMLPNGPEFPVAILGALQAGCIVSTINPLYKEFEICHQVSTTNPKVIVTMPECYETVVKGLEAAKVKAKIILVNPDKSIPEGVIRYSEAAETGEADYTFLDKIKRSKDDIAVIPFSSGTTGLPKGVSITHGNLLAALEIMAVKENCYPILTHGNFQDVVPCILPFYHIYGLVVALLGHFANGCKLVTLPKFTTGLYLDVLKNYDPAILYVVPPIAILLGKHPDVTSDHFKLVRHVVSGAAPLAATDALAVLEKGNGTMEINQGYGATETTSLSTSTLCKTKDLDYAACGVLMANMELKIVDPLTGKDLPVDQTGDICIRSPTVMQGYYKNEQATKETMTEDGFFKTGDLGSYNPKHGLYIFDRIKELIKVKGLQVAPAELEGLLRTHPAVQEAAVIGVPHMFYGETPVAYVIKKDGLNASPEELRSFVADKVAAFKKIEEVVFVNDIPKTASGKILRRELKKMYA